jgi:type III secretory pathway lipoprotein EscJ
MGPSETADGRAVAILRTNGFPGMDLQDVVHILVAAGIRPSQTSGDIVAITRRAADTADMTKSDRRPHGVLEATVGPQA